MTGPGGIDVVGGYELPPTATEAERRLALANWLGNEKHPLTARVLGAANDLLRGVNGSLRANYTGGPVSLSDPTLDEFFNVAAFALPAPGTFGDSSRNMIVGPGARQLNGLFQRDIRMGGNRSLTLQVNAINLLNTVQWAAVDTNINSPTFGHVLAAPPESRHVNASNEPIRVD